MSESNLQSDAEKTEQNLEKPDNGQSPSDEENQEQSVLSIDSPSLDVSSSFSTIPPSNHGWLEQIEAFGVEAFQRLEEVATQGLLEIESDLLVNLSAKLLRLAYKHDPKALSKLLDLVDDLN